MIWDDINTLIIAICFCFLVTNIAKLVKDKRLMGIAASSLIFFAIQSGYRVFYMYHLHQYYSMVGQSFITLANLVYIGILLYYKRKQT
jgi:hypothetical protein